MSGPRRKNPDSFANPPMDSVPRQWQTPPPAWSDYQGPDEDILTPEETDRQLRGAFWAGANGDTGALDSFPPNDFGLRQRAEYLRGLKSRRKKRGLGFAGDDPSG